MASNSRSRTVSYTPRFTQMEAYDLLPPPVRDALKEGPQEWDTVSILRAWKKNQKVLGGAEASRRSVKAIAAWDRHEIAEGKPWRPRKPGQRWSSVPPSPHNLAKAKMARSAQPYRSL